VVRGRSQTRGRVARRLRRAGVVGGADCGIDRGGVSVPRRPSPRSASQAAGG
jgi:hypothetical protein